MSADTTNGSRIEELERQRIQDEAEERERLDQLFADNREWLECDQRHGYVYFLEGGDHMKIGWARDVRERITELQTGCPYDITINDVIADERAKNLERILHFFFRKHHQRGEWYELYAGDREKVAEEWEKWAAHIADVIRGL